MPASAQPPVRPAAGAVAVRAWPHATAATSTSAHDRRFKRVTVWQSAADPLIGANRPGGALIGASARGLRPGADRHRTKDAPGSRHAAVAPSQGQRMRSRPGLTQQVRRLGGATILNPEGRQRRQRGVIAPAPVAQLHSGVEQRRVPRGAVAPVQIADHCGARPSRALGLPVTGARTRRGPFMVGRRASALAAPIADRGSHPLAGPRTRGGRPARCARGATQGRWVGDRSAAIRAAAGVKIVVHA